MEDTSQSGLHCDREDEINLGSADSPPEVAHVETDRSQVKMRPGASGGLAKACGVTHTKFRCLSVRYEGIGSLSPRGEGWGEGPSPADVGATKR
jgi:hypothetical protein